MSPPITSNRSRLNPSPPESADQGSGPASVLLEATFEAEGRALFDQLEHEVGLSPGAVTIEALTLLYWLRTQPPTTKPDMIRALAQWRGGASTLKPIGAGPEFLELLLKVELLVEMGNPKRFLVSPKGIGLLGRLHRGCEDLDLPVRLQRWEAAWPTSEGKVLGYVRAFVARQRVFVN